MLLSPDGNYLAYTTIKRRSFSVTDKWTQIIFLILKIILLKKNQRVRNVYNFRFEDLVFESSEDYLYYSDGTRLKRYNINTQNLEKIADLGNRNFIDGIWAQ